MNIAIIPIRKDGSCHFLITPRARTNIGHTRYSLHAAHIRLATVKIKQVYKSRITTTCMLVKHNNWLVLHVGFLGIKYACPSIHETSNLSILATEFNMDTIPDNEHHINVF
ncbi:hypothetical protein Peur_058781 [Populus x canadensis]